MSIYNLRYVGSKNKISKDLVPIIQSYITEETNGYLEPFVGGANVIDKIKCKKKIGLDIHEELIELLKKAQTDYIFPECILEDEYHKVKNNKDQYEKWYVGLVGFCASFGAKYFGGYARDSKDDNSGKWSKGAINNLNKQRENLKDIHFKCMDFRFIPKEKIKNYVIYCDIPYRGTLEYKTKKFPYDDFYEWCKELSIHNTILISEYEMPNEFDCLWEMKHKTLMDCNKQSGDDGNIRIERLYTYKNVI